MAINRIAIGEWEEYVPDVEGQRELFLDEPEEAVTVEIRAMSRDEMCQHARRAKRMKKSGATTADEDAARQLFADHVRNVRNVEIDGKTVTSGVQLFDSNEIELITDLTKAIMSRSSLDNGLVKKLRRRSDSSSSRRQNNAGGGAPNATPRSTQKAQEIQEEQPRKSGSQMKPNVPQGTVRELQIPASISTGTPIGEPAPEQN